ELQVHDHQQRERLGQGDEPRHQRQGLGGAGGDGDDRADQAGRGVSSIALGAAIPAHPRKKRLTTWQTWGLILIAPYVLVFLVFVLYPVLYGLWLARDPASYVKLWDDPVFLRSVANTSVFLLVGINLKMLIALF